VGDKVILREGENTIVVTRERQKESRKRHEERMVNGHKGFVKKRNNF
jgi:hypothetical protein